MPGFLPLLLIAIIVIVAIAIVVFLRRRRREAQEAAIVAAATPVPELSEDDIAWRIGVAGVDRPEGDAAAEGFAAAEAAAFYAAYAGDHETGAAGEAPVRAARGPGPRRGRGRRHDPAPRDCRRAAPEPLAPVARQRRRPARRGPGGPRRHGVPPGHQPERRSEPVTERGRGGRLPVADGVAHAAAPAHARSRRPPSRSRPSSPRRRRRPPRRRRSPRPSGRLDPRLARPPGLPRRPPSPRRSRPPSPRPSRRRSRPRSPRPSRPRRRIRSRSRLRPRAAPAATRSSSAVAARPTRPDYTWDFDDGAGSNAANPEHTYDADGSYTAILTVSGPGGQDTDSVSVSVPCS